MNSIPRRHVDAGRWLGPLIMFIIVCWLALIGAWTVLSWIWKAIG